MGAKGGVGTTSIAVNLASAIAMTRMRTTLIDAHLQQPTVAHLLGKSPLHSLLELTARQTELDQRLVRVCSTEVDPSIPLNFISPPLDGSANVKSNLTELAHSFSKIRDCSGAWILDMPANLDKHLVTMLDVCSQILLVFEPTVTGVATCKRWLEVFKELGYGNEKVICVLNRSGSKFRAVEDQLDAIFADQSLVKIPNAAQLLWQSETQGVPAVVMQPNNVYSRSIKKLAETVAIQSMQERP
jgi:pilus assembly protein CpaE